MLAQSPSRIATYPKMKQQKIVMDLWAMEADIFNDGGVIKITDSTIFENKAANDGGGVYNGFSSDTTYGGTTQRRDNEATTGYGGGVYSDFFRDDDGIGVAGTRSDLPGTTDGTHD